MPIIDIDNIGKFYRIGANKERCLSLRDEIAKRLSPKARRSRAAEREFWALKNVSFSVLEGEVVGIIGGNGAGKTTLLKILSRITPPTEGKVTLRGRVASLLEVGTGFHPELTGRENTYLNGAILGMTRGEVGRKFDEIMAFAEIDRFLDTPVKRYSSGMYVRLAFAIAAHLDPDILLVDEVLAVGDVAFQNKCLAKMDEVAKGGRTVLFVSHNMSTISQLCTRCVVLAGGRVDYIGATRDAIMHYTPRGSADGAAHVTFCRPESSEGDQVAARFDAVRLTNSTGSVADVFLLGDSMTVRMDVTFNKRVDNARLSFSVRSATGVKIYHCVMQDAGFHATDVLGPVSFSATFPRLSLYPGRYFIGDLWLATSFEELDTVRGDAVSFCVAEGGERVSRELGKDAAVVHEVPQWALETDGEQPAAPPFRAAADKSSRPTEI